MLKYVLLCFAELALLCFAIFCYALLCYALPGFAWLCFALQGPAGEPSGRPCWGTLAPGARPRNPKSKERFHTFAQSYSKEVRTPLGKA